MTGRSMTVLMGGDCDDGADHDSVNGRGLVFQCYSFVIHVLLWSYNTIYFN